ATASRLARQSRPSNVSARVLWVPTGSYLCTSAGYLCPGAIAWHQLLFPADRHSIGESSTSIARLLTAALLRAVVSNRAR
ncbi:MAG: hypothetical protein ABSE95_19335, partial [Thermodesulfobacteriota bacterium]